MTKRPSTPNRDEPQQFLIQQNLKAQKEAEEKYESASKEEKELDYKRECRRTALQLSERFSKDSGDGSRESNPVYIIANAEILYGWLISGDSSKDWLDTFFKTGVLKYKK